MDVSVAKERKKKKKEHRGHTGVRAKVINPRPRLPRQACEGEDTRSWQGFLKKKSKSKSKENRNSPEAANRLEMVLNMLLVNCFIVNYSFLCAPSRSIQWAFFGFIEEELCRGGNKQTKGLNFYYYSVPEVAIVCYFLDDQKKYSTKAIYPFFGEEVLIDPPLPPSLPLFSCLHITT